MFRYIIIATGTVSMRVVFVHRPVRVDMRGVDHLRVRRPHAQRTKRL